MNFRIWLESVEALPPAQFLNSDGSINLYRYSKSPKGDTYRIDPAKASPSSYSMREFQSAATKRTFFYLNPLKDKEQFIGDHLYVVKHPANKIYNVLIDPLQIKEEAKKGHQVDGVWINRGVINFDKLLSLVIESGFDGMYYKPGGMELVTMLVPVLGYKTTEEEVAAKQQAA